MTDPLWDRSNVLIWDADSRLYDYDATRPFDYGTWLNQQWIDAHVLPAYAGRIHVGNTGTIDSVTLLASGGKLHNAMTFPTALTTEEIASLHTYLESIY